jgi:hypothetical protein
MNGRMDYSYPISILCLWNCIVLWMIWFTQGKLILRTHVEFNQRGIIGVILIDWRLCVKIFQFEYVSPRWPRGQCASAIGMRSRKLSNVGRPLDHWLRWPKVYFLELRVSEGTSSRWSRLHLQLLAPTNPHWANVVGYGPFSLCVIHKEGLCPNRGDINRLMR